jgi:hypothetical protein
MARFNWQMWAGFLLSIIGFISYPLVFVNWPVTRDFPWVNLLLYALSIILLISGLDRAWRRNPTRSSRVVSLALATISVLVLGFFVFSVFIYARWLPPSTEAPQIGQRAHDFSLVASNGESVTLSELLTTPIAGKAPRGVLLIFYRGYW